MHIHNMKIERELSWFVMLIDVLGLIAPAVCQYYKCTEFHSPLMLQVDDSQQGSLQIPITGETYDSNQMCEWIIETGNKRSGIQLDVTECTLQGKDIYGDCSNDYVDIFDSTSGFDVFIDRFCGIGRGNSYKITGTRMTVRFQSDSILQFSGFKATYKSVPADETAELQSKEILGLSVGIPFGVLILTVAVTITVYKCRQHQQKKSTRIVNPGIFAQQNGSSEYSGHSGGNMPGALSDIHEGNHVYSNELNSFQEDLQPFSRNQHLQILNPVSLHEHLRSSRSITPPPNYESLSFEDGCGYIQQAPPPYDAVVVFKSVSSDV